MSTAFIDDGYTEEQTFAATDKYPAVTIKFRPMLRQQRDDLSRMSRAVDALERSGCPADELKRRGRELHKAVSEALAAHVVTWDITDSRDQPVDPKDPKNWSGVEPHLLEKIYIAVANYGRADEIEASRAERDDEGNSRAASV